MKVIKVHVSPEEVLWMESLADDFNGNDDVAALRVAEDEYYIAADGARSMDFVLHALDRNLFGYSVNKIK